MTPAALDEFRGLTWSHPRGSAPLRALAQLARIAGPLEVIGSAVSWDDQSLAGFESHPIEEIARSYQLLVLDHPGLGDAMVAGALAPLDELVEQSELAAWSAASLPGSFESYTYLGHQWAAPIDAAAQVLALRDVEIVDSPPTTWSDVIDLSVDCSVALATAGPHTLLTFLGICAAHDPAFEPDDDQLVPPDIARAGLVILKRLLSAMPNDQLDKDPIQLLESMRSPGNGKGPDCLPLVFGYVTYSNDEARPVLFCDAPALIAGEPPGSVLGGTGLAVSRNAGDDRRVIDHVRQAMHPQAQETVIPESGGQPSAVRAWESSEINARSNGFYARTRRTHEHAWRRPRFPGWIRFQTEGSRLLYDGLARAAAADTLIGQLNACYRERRTHGYPN